MAKIIKSISGVDLNGNPVQVNAAVTNMYTDDNGDLNIKTSEDLGDKADANIVITTNDLTVDSDKVIINGDLYIKKDTDTVSISDEFDKKADSITVDTINKRTACVNVVTDSSLNPNQLANTIISAWYEDEYKGLPIKVTYHDYSDSPLEIWGDEEVLEGRAFPNLSIRPNVSQIDQINIVLYGSRGIAMINLKKDNSGNWTETKKIISA